MKFKYQAKTKDGETQVGFVEAGSRDAAANILAGHDLYVLGLESTEKRRWYDAVAGLFGRVKRKDMVVFTRQLATLLEARLPLNASLKTLYEQTSNQLLKEAIYRVGEDVDSGLSFSQAIERQGNIFPTYYIEMIRAAEITGNLNEISGFLADYTEKEGVLVSRAYSAMIYPAIVILLFFAVAILMVTFVFPQLAPVFENSNVELPIYTKILLGSGDFLSRWWAAAVLAIVILAIVIVDYVNTPEGKSLIDDAKIKLPILNRVYLPLTMARFSSAASLLIHGGIPIAQMLEVTSHMVGNVLYRDMIHEVAEGVRQGELLSQSVSKYPEYFPKLVSQMISVGEQTGQLEQIFSRLSSLYGREADSMVDNMVTLLQPILLMGLGVLVAFMFASILIPLYSLTASVG